MKRHWRLSSPTPPGHILPSRLHADVAPDHGGLTSTPTFSSQHALALRLIGMSMSGLATFCLTALGWLFFWAQAPQLIGWKTLAITSGSMQPRIGVGDAVIVEPGVGSLSPGRLVTFHDQARPGKTVTHRLVRYNNDGTWTTKGDANPTNDSTPVPTAAIIGSAKAVIPYVGLPTVWRQSGHYVQLALLAGVVVTSLAALPISSRLEQTGLAVKALPEPAPPQPATDTQDGSSLPVAQPIPRQMAWGQRARALSRKHREPAAPQAQPPLLLSPYPWDDHAPVG